MYLRTTKRKNKDGSTVEYYQLAHNERHPKTRKPVARIIHNFGRADQIEDEQLIRLCKSIGRVCGLEISDPRIDSPDENVKCEEYDDFKIIKTYAYGCPMVIETLWAKLGIKKVLEDMASKKQLKIKGLCWP